MGKKLIIGISSYAGSDTTHILSEVERFVISRSHRKFRIYTLKEYEPEKIVELIRTDTEENVVYVIKHIRMVKILQFFRVELQDHEFKPIGIEVPWEQCFENFQKKGEISVGTNPDDWREVDKKLQFRNDILECMDAIGTRNDNIYLYQFGSECEQIGRIADMILLS